MRKALGHAQKPFRKYMLRVCSIPRVKASHDHDLGHTIETSLHLLPMEDNLNHNPKIRDGILGVLVLRTIDMGGPILGPPTYGNCQILDWQPSDACKTTLTQIGLLVTQTKPHNKRHTATTRKSTSAMRRCRTRHA